MRTLRMTMLLSAVLGATAGGQTARDTAVMRANALKTRLDSTNTLSTVPLGNYCRQYSTVGWFRNGPCLWQAPLLTRANSDLTSLLLVMARLTKTDTVIKRDTLIRVVHDTVYAPQPTPTPVVAVATVTTSLASRSLLVGQTTQATAIAKDSAGTTLTRTVAWSSSAPAVASVSTSGLVTALGAGTSQITARVDTKTSYTTLTVTAPIPPPTDTVTPPPPTSTDAELPRVYLNTAVSNTPSTGRTLTVSTVASLQPTLDSMRQGDKIVLACGVPFAGNFTVPAKTGTAWSAITSNCATVAEGQRMTPALAVNLPKLKSMGAGAALRFLPGAHHWRVSFVEITADASTSTNTWGLVNIGEGAETSVAQLPGDIILDRVYIHGNTTLDVRRAVTNNGARVAVIDSWISEIHSKFDAQGISGWNGPGPYKYVNNFIEASAASIGSGGSDPTIAGMVPADFEIRRNHLTKNLAWKGIWVLKTILETKNARRLLIDGNVMENSAQDGQQGFALVFFSQNQQHTAPWSVTEHITITNNVMRNVNAGFQLGAQYYTNDAVSMNHVTIRNNVLIGVDGPSQAGIGTSFGRVFQIAGVIPQLTIEHNTGFSPNSSTFIWDDAAVAVPDQRIRNNLGGGGNYQIFNGVTAPGLPAWQRVAGPGSEFVGNVVALFQGQVIPGNHFPTLEQVGLVGGPIAAYSPTAILDQLVLAAGTWYKGAATDGTDPGADIAKVKAATAGVVITQPMSTRRIPLRKP